MKIRWINKYSNETGYVKSIDYKNKHFNNTFNENEAKNFSSETNVNKAIAKLNEYGEGDNNYFEIVS